jgi:hypothetical protein
LERITTEVCAFTLQRKSHLHFDKAVIQHSP